MSGNTRIVEAVNWVHGYAIDNNGNLGDVTHYWDENGNETEFDFADIAFIRWRNDRKWTWHRLSDFEPIKPH